ncbi:immunity 50 family protein [Pseudomonas sp. SAICEU22]|uniref:Immunity 50 family protein n=1 Tax=Pseudomonas agronomica TaxID=2979328 RepID=A0ABT3F536_9PSED|nr:immunity 50 family protein [Pseudomonas agronomica]MCW1244189.1 immunity 50 family protein [Pseudomonas agronomica]
MIFWNNLERSIFFNKIFSSPIPIGEIELASLTIDNNIPTIILEFDISEYPDAPPQKWKQAGFNICRIGLNCGTPQKTKIINIPTNDKLIVQITQQQDSFLIQASNDTSLIELETKHLLLCGPSAYKKCDSAT